MIEIKNLSYNPILEDISFKLERGKIVMLLGENGCGKTTLIKNILDILPLSSGHITFNGNDLSGFTSVQRASVFSYVPQIKSLVESITVEECVVSGRTRFISTFDTPKESDYQKARELLDELGILHLKDKLLNEISGGELQLAYVAKALIQDASVLVMDEPCTYLDFQKQYLFLEKISNLRKMDKTLLISIHDPNLALRYADEIILMSKGKIYAKLSKDDDNFKQRCCEYYNELFGNHFVYNEESDFLFWK